MPIVHNTQHPIRRGTFLRGAAVAAGGIAGLGGVAAQASPSPTPRPASGGGGITVPESWGKTVIATGLADDQYIDNLTPLYDAGPVTSLSPAELAESEALADFTRPGDTDGSESFTPHITGDLVLDDGPRAVLLTGDKGTRIHADAYLVRSANPEANAVILKVADPARDPLVLPRKARLVWGFTTKGSPDAVSTKEATTVLADAVGTSYQTNGPNPTDTMDVQVRDSGELITGYARYTEAGDAAYHAWCGVAVRSREAGTWGYLFGQLPEE